MKNKKEPIEKQKVVYNVNNMTKEEKQEFSKMLNKELASYLQNKNKNEGK